MPIDCTLVLGNPRVTKVDKAHVDGVGVDLLVKEEDITTLALRWGIKAC